MKPWRSILLVLAAGAALILAAVGTWASVQIPISLMRQQGQWQQIEATHEALPLPAGARLTSRRVETPGVYSLICISGRLECPYDDRQYDAVELSAGQLRQMLSTVTGRSGGDDAVGRWFGLYDQAKMANGQINYEKLERLQAEFRTRNPGIDAKVGGEFDCTFTGPEGPYKAHLKITSVDGEKVGFDIKTSRA